MGNIRWRDQKNKTIKVAMATRGAVKTYFRNAEKNTAMLKKIKELKEKENNVNQKEKKD